MKIKLVYIWLDGYQPEPNIRSKVKVIDSPRHVVNGQEIYGITIDDCPEWSFDGSSTKQADGNFSDLILKPVRISNDPINSGLIDSYLVLCEVMYPDGTPHLTNIRSLITSEDNDLWFGFEQEYTMTQNQKPLGFPINGYPEPQGKYYCGIGNGIIHQREFVDKHMEACINAGIEITGINAEVMSGQWEYQVFSKGKLRAADDLWLSRYLLLVMSESYGFDIEFHPKPVMGDWNGSGLHCNFSDKEMREDGNKFYFDAIFSVFNGRHPQHIEQYGSSNELRLTGKHETQSIDKFTWGVSDRGASIRIPLQTANDWCGYLEDRRPASNADPYRIVKVISESLEFAKELKRTLKYMYDKGVVETNEKHNIKDMVFDEEFKEKLKEDYMTDELTETIENEQ